MTRLSRLLYRLARQTAVYWGSPTPNGDGQSEFVAPIEIKVRWEDEEEYMKAEGKEDQEQGGGITARIICPDDLDIGGYLYLGTLTEIGSEANPIKVDGAFRIKNFRKVPGISDAGDFLEYMV